MRFRDIVPLTSWGSYNTDIAWKTLKRSLDDYNQAYRLELEPDFQRGRVWSRSQQIAYLEFICRGGKSGKDILWNCPAFYHKSEVKDSTMQLVDGLQRVTAVLGLLNNEIPIFGSYYDEFEDGMAHHIHRFHFHINDLQTRQDVLRWYLEVNSGTPHSEQELERVKSLLESEQ